MKDVLQHDFLKDTEETHPTSSLTELVKTYYAWLFSGGQRVSLFMPGGAAAAATEDSDEEISASDEWNFSMTQDFERRVSASLEIPDLSDLSAVESMEGEETPKGPRLSPPKEMTAAQKANFEARVKRGADLSNIFDQAKPAYEYKTKTDFVPVPEQRRTSDLPFRAMAEDRPSSIASNVIDLGDFDEADYAVAAPRTDDKIQTTYAATPMREETIRLADASTLREKRANSKGPRDSSTTQSLTARRTSLADDGGLASASTSAQDFALSQQNWTVKDRPKGPELQEPAEITPSQHPGHATMDWSFAKAMSAVSLPEGTVTRKPPTEFPGGEESVAASEEKKAQKHATMEWSFKNAMAEASAVTELEPSTSVPPPTRTTPARPAPLVRQMTMPVTLDDFQQVEEQDVPRPSTALSEAYSETSQSSTDVDPFGLEQTEDDYPALATLDEVGMAGYYTERGRTLVGDRGVPYHPPAPGPGLYGLPRPLRMGEDGFPFSGPTQGQLPTRPRMHGNGAGSDSSASAGTRAVVDVPEATPPSMAVLSASASNDKIEAELTRMLEGMRGTLDAASQVVQTQRKRGRNGRPSSSEWSEDE